MKKLLLFLIGVLCFSVLVNAQDQYCYQCELIGGGTPLWWIGPWAEPFTCPEGYEYVVGTFVNTCCNAPNYECCDHYCKYTYTDPECCGKDIDDPTMSLDLKDLQITKTLRGTYKGTFDTSVKFENYEKDKIQKELEKVLRHKYGEDGPKTYRDELKSLTCDKKSVEEFLKKTELNDFSTDINWEFVNCSQCHTALSRRMGERDPGNKPQSNDRIPFVYIQVKEKKGVIFVCKIRLFMFFDNRYIDFFFPLNKIALLHTNSRH